MSELTIEYIIENELHWEDTDEWENIDEINHGHTEHGDHTQFVFKNVKDGELWSVMMLWDSWGENREFSNIEKVRLEEKVVTKTVKEYIKI